MWLDCEALFFAGLQSEFEFRIGLSKLPLHDRLIGIIVMELYAATS